MQTEKVEPLFKETYIAMIENSEGTQMFQNLYARVNGEKKDITRAGELSCAFFVSSVLKIFDLIEEVHATVDGTVRDLYKSGWFEIEGSIDPSTEGSTSKILPGVIIVWEEKEEKGERHKHIGFYLGNNEAISNSAKEKVPKKHHFIYNGEREILKAFWNSKFD